MLRNPIPFVLAFLLSVAVSAQPPFVGLGDSIGEAVQSGDCTYRTQPHGYLSVIAAQMGVPLPLPLIEGGALTFIRSVNGRRRVDPNVAGLNLAVSGADSTSILREVSAAPPAKETDLVLLPRIGSQVEVAERLRAPFMVCWIGNNDVLASVITHDQLNASQLTPEPVFAANFRELVARLSAWGAKTVYGNIPDVVDIAFLFGPDDLRRWLGDDYGLPAGSYTSLVAMLLIKIGADDGSILRNPDWVLDPGEVATISNHVQALNRVIAETAAAAGMPVADIHSLYDTIARQPFSFAGVTITTRFNGGLFSLDGVHPSDFAHALAANVFIRTANDAFGTDIPRLGVLPLLGIMVRDPFVDFDGDLVVRGRPFAGLIETLGPMLGISGDTADGYGVPAGSARASVDPTLAPRFMAAYRAARGERVDAPWTAGDVKAALGEVFGARIPARPAEGVCVPYRAHERGEPGKARAIR